MGTSDFTSTGDGSRDLKRDSYIGTTVDSVSLEKTEEE